MSDLATLAPAAPGDAAVALALIAAGIRAGKLVPYLGPGVLAAASEQPPVPITPEAIALELHKRAPAPGRIRTNMWAVAQFVEQRRHRKTLIAMMADIFAAPVAPSELHRKLAALPIPLIVDTWYDGAMRLALADRTDWFELQGITRALENSDIWIKAYNAAGEKIPVADVPAVQTILYKPHGAVTPDKNFLIADSDYVEVLTEIDIQTPIPDLVKQIRATRGFVFIGCRFHDQMLRTYARQIAKRSAGPHYVLIDDGELTRNEHKFFVELGATVVKATIGELAAAI
jgi:hypothetical protein